MKILITLIMLFIFAACSSSSIDEKYAQISKTMTRAQVIEIMSQPTSTETRERIECLAWDIDTPNSVAYYGVFIDIEKGKVIDTFATTEPLENSKRYRWQRYLANKIDKIANRH